MKLRFLWWVALCLGLFACPPPIDVADSGTFVVGPNGTDALKIVNGVGFEVPKGAVSEDTTITVTIIDTGIPEVPMRKRISYGFRISPSTLKFASPIKLYLPWDDKRLVQGVDIGTYDMRRQTSMDPYLALSNTAASSLTKQVSANTDRLGLFWITSPIDPNIASLEIDPTEAFINVGETQQFTATVKDPTGAPVAVDLHWTSWAQRIGTVTDGNDGGLFTGNDPGIATVQVRAGSVSARAKIHVKGNTKGPSTFVHENPFPTGNDLWGGSVGPLGTAFVGENGTVLIRDSQGAYTRAFSSPGLTLKGIAGTTLQNAVAVGAFGTSGVLVELTNMQPKVTTYQATQITDLKYIWFDGTYGMAVGAGNDVVERRNGVWTRVYNPSFEPLLGVVGDGAGSFVVLGGQGSIYKYDPATQRWNSLFQTQLAVLLTAGALVGNDGREAWACGGNKLWHFQNAAWTSINLPPSPYFTEATALGLVDGKIVIGGRVNKTGWAEVYDPNAMPPDGGSPAADAGSTDAGDPDAGSSDAGVADAGTPMMLGWTIIPMRGPQIPRGFFGSGSSSQVGWLVGDYGAVWHYANGTLVEDSKGFYGDVAALVAAGTDVIAAVNECANSNCTAFTPAVYNRDSQGVFSPLGPAGFAVTLSDGGYSPIGGKIWSMTARSKNDVVVAVANPAGMSPFVYWFDGTDWNVSLLSGVAGALLAMRYCGTNVYGVGIGGVWVRGGATLLSRQPAFGMDNLWSLHCKDESDMWTAGDGVLFERVGTSGWIARDSMDVMHAPYRAVWSPGAGESFQFGDARFGTYWDTQELNLIDSPGGTLPDVINGLWGSNAGNLYAVGLHQPVPVTFGLGLRFDGSDWRLVDMGSQRAVTAIDGTTDTSVFIGTKGGGVLRGVTP